MVDMVVDQGALGLGHRPFDGVKLGGKVKAGSALGDHCHHTAQVAFGPLQTVGNGRVACMAVRF
jgi:hypothetical protein